MAGITLHDLADDVAAVIRELGDGSALLLGHALSRMVAADHHELVGGIILAASQGSEVPSGVAGTFFTLANPDEPETERLAVLQKAFFAPGHAAGPWFAGWYPETLKTQHEAAKIISPSAHWACGRVPMLEVFGALDPFKPKTCWHELSDQLGSRVTLVRTGNISHALLPEQPDRVAEAVLSWLSCHREAAAKPRNQV